MRNVETAVQQIKDVGHAIIPKLIFGARLRQAQADAEALLEATPIEMPGLDGKVFGRMCKGGRSASLALSTISTPIPRFLPSFAACWSTLTESAAATSSAVASSSRRS